MLAVVIAGAAATPRLFLPQPRPVTFRILNILSEDYSRLYQRRIFRLVLAEIYIRGAIHRLSVFSFQINLRDPPSFINVPIAPLWFVILCARKKRREQIRLTKI